MTDKPSAWQRPGFRQLARAWFFTNLADAALFLMVAVWVKDLTDSDSAALVFVMLGLPALIAPILGQFTDRTSRRRLLVAANLIAGPVVISLLLVNTAADLWLIYVVTFLYGAMGYLTASGQSGLIRDLLPDEELASGNGLLSTIDTGLRLISPLIGTGLYVLVGPKAVAGLTAACFAVTATLLYRLRVKESPPTPTGERAGYWTELGAGIRHLVRTPVLGRLAAVIAIGFGATGLVNATVFPAMEQGFRVDPSLLGVLVSIQGIGSVAGGLTAARAVARLGERRAVQVGMALLGLGILPVAGPWLWLAIGLVMVGFGVPWVVVAFSTLRQRLTPAQLQGRASAASNVAFNLPQTVATTGAAALLAIVDYRFLVVATVVAVLGSALAARVGVEHGI